MVLEPIDSLDARAIELQAQWLSSGSNLDLKQLVEVLAKLARGLMRSILRKRRVISLYSRDRIRDLALDAVSRQIEILNRRKESGYRVESFRKTLYPWCLDSLKAEYKIGHYRVQPEKTPQAPKEVDAAVAWEKIAEHEKGAWILAALLGSRTFRAAAKKVDEITDRAWLMRSASELHAVWSTLRTAQAMRRKNG